MAIVLYKKGNSYTSPKGIRCQIQICNPFSYEHLLDQGWFRTPEEVELDKKKAEAEVKVEAETKVKVEDKKAKVEDKKAKVETEDSKAKIIKELKAKKAELLANQDKE